MEEVIFIDVVEYKQNKVRSGAEDVIQLQQSHDKTRIVVSYG